MKNKSGRYWVTVTLVEPNDPTDTTLRLSSSFLWTVTKRAKKARAVKGMLN
jgi:hypothetical protein